MTADEPEVPGAHGPVETPRVETPRSFARNAALLAGTTGLSRVAGVGREIVAASQFGVSGQMSAFTVAFQIPNLFRALFADSALQSAFVPVFTQMLEKGDRREAIRVASALFMLICFLLGAVSLLFVLLAPVVVPLAAPGFNQELVNLTANLTRIMFPLVLLLALSGLVAGMLNSLEHFTAPAIAPVAWNLVIIASILGLTPLLSPGDEIYAYAIGVLVGTVVQFLLPMPWLRARGVRLQLNLRVDWRSRHVKQVLALMVPITLTTGLINFSDLISSFFGTLVQVEAPAAIDKALKIWMLPQALVSISIVTVLFPTLGRLAARGARDELRQTVASGMRQIALLLIPAAVLMAVLAEPIARLIYERGEFDAAATDLVAEALLWWSVGLPFSGIGLLYARTFFSLQQPWWPTLLAVGNLLVHSLVALLLYEPLGVAGVVLGAGVAITLQTIVLTFVLRVELGGLELRRTASSVAWMAVGSVLLGFVAYAVWSGLDHAFGRSIGAQIGSLAVGIACGGVAYFAVVIAARVREAIGLANHVPGLRRLTGGRT